MTNPDASISPQEKANPRKDADLPAGSPKPREVTSPFPSRRQMHQDSPRTAATAEGWHAIPMWKKILGAVAIVVALASIPLGGWRTVDSAQDVAQSFAVDEPQSLGPFSLAVHSAVWLEHPKDFPWLSPEDSYLAMKVLVTGKNTTTPMAADTLRQMLTVNTPGAEDAQSAATGGITESVGDLFKTIEAQPQRSGMRLWDVVRSQDFHSAEIIQPGFDQEFIVFWVRDKAQGPTSHVEVTTYSMTEQRSTLNDVMVWLPSELEGYLLLPVKEGIE